MTLDRCKTCAVQRILQTLFGSSFTNWSVMENTGSRAVSVLFNVYVCNLRSDKATGCNELNPSTSQTKHQHDPSLASSRTIHDAQDQDLERVVQKSHLHHQHGWQQDFETVGELTSAHDFHGKCGSVNEHFEVGISPDLTIREENYSRDVCCPVCQLPLPNETTSEEQTQQQHFTSTPQVICEDCWLLVGMI